MKVCRICPSFPESGYGTGLELHVYYLSLQQAKSSIKLSVITAGKREEVKSYKGIKIYKIESRKPFILRTGPELLRKARELSEKENFDILQIHNPILFPLSLNGVAKKIIYTIHGSILHHKRIFSPKNIIAPLKSYISYYMLSKWICKKVDHITTVSSALRNEIIKHYGISPKKISVIPSGVDIKIFNKKMKTDLKKRLGLTGPVLLFVGRFVKVKGLEYLLHALPAVLKQNPDTRLLLVGGTKSDNDYKNVENLIRELNLDKSVTIMNAVPYSKIHEFYSICDIYVQSSLSEGLPKSLIEAMACGKPVVATNIGGHEDVVINNKTGLLVPTKDPENLTKNINLLLKDKKLRERIGDEGRKLIESRYTWEEISKMYEKIYKNLLR